MALLSDLDFLSGAATIAAVVLSAFVTFLVLRDWRNGWKIEFEAPARLIVFLGMLCLIGAANSFSPDQNAPRKTIEGVVRFVGKVQGRHSFSEYICASSCQLTGGYALALDARGAFVARIGSSYRFTYLEQPKGNIYSGISLKVVQIAEADSGRILYALDLTNHPYRIAAYLFDFVLLICPFALAVRLDQMQDRKRDSEGASSEDDKEKSVDDEPASQDPGPISLHLESKDNN